MKNTVLTKKSGIIDFLAAIFIIGLSIYIVGIDFFGCDFSENNLYLNTTDALPIYAKVNYITEHIKNGSWPLWFPIWYCGTSISQYYPPLSYVLLVPLDLMFKNDNVCLQIYMFTGLIAGGMGVWYIFYRYLGRLWGILAGVLYSTLPYFTISFLFWGVIAQVPIIAIAPWYVICCLNFYRSPKLRWFLAICVLTFVLLLSHVMHAFMIAVCTFVPMTILSFKQKKSPSIMIMWIISTGLSAGVLGFWWVTGVLPLENPGVPYLDPGSAKDVTANLTWFFPYFSETIQKIFPDMHNVISAYFPVIIIIISFFSIIFIKKEEESFKKTVLRFLFIQTVFSFVFSFGSYLPFYEFIPLAKQLVPGRIVTQTAIGAVILTVYVIKCILEFFNEKKGQKLYLLKRGFSLIIALTLCILTYQSYTYYKFSSPIVFDFSVEKDIYSSINDNKDIFEKGRAAWFGNNFSSSYTYFAEKYNCNIISGWNIEGTTMGDYLRYQNIALVFQKKEYILKKIYDMNIQYCFVNGAEFPWLRKYLEKNSFQLITVVDGISILKRKDNNYFLEQIRNAVVIGRSANVFLSEFPWFARGQSANPTKYGIDYFKDFDTIYYCEPEITDRKQVNLFEKQVIELQKRGKKIFIEFGRTSFPYTLLGVSPYDYEQEGEYYLYSNDDLNGRPFYTSAKGGRLVELFGLDHTIYKIEHVSGCISHDLLGTKKVGNGDVYFIGGPLSQMKHFAFSYLTGIREFEDEIKKRDVIISKIFSKLFDYENLYTRLDLPIPELNKIEWQTNKASFNYDSDADKKIMASLTYTPRWKVYIDGNETEVYKIDNMVVFDVPSGRHYVEMIYNITIYSKMGILITIISMIMIIGTSLKYRKIFIMINKISRRLFIYFELLNNRFKVKQATKLK